MPSPQHHAVFVDYLRAHRDDRGTVGDVARYGLPVGLHTVAALRDQFRGDRKALIALEEAVGTWQAQAFGPWLRAQRHRTDTVGTIARDYGARTSRGPEQLRRLVWGRTATDGPDGQPDQTMLKAVAAAKAEWEAHAYGE